MRVHAYYSDDRWMRNVLHTMAYAMPVELWLRSIPPTRHFVYVDTSSRRHSSPLLLPPHQLIWTVVKKKIYTKHVRLMWVHRIRVFRLWVRTATTCDQTVYHYNGILRNEYDWSTKLCHHLFWFRCKTWLPCGILCIFHRIYCAAHLPAHFMFSIVISLCVVATLMCTHFPYFHLLCLVIW